MTDRIKSMLKSTQEMTEEKAKSFGKDYAINGANETNCHFSIFSTPEFTRAWEKGRDENV